MAHIQVKFFTQQKRYKVIDSPFSVLGSVSSTELNDLINKLLHDQIGDETATQVNFEFLVKDELLRSSLLDHMQERGLSVESVLSIEYFEKQTAPELELCLEHNDWVSGIRLCEDYLLTGTYDCAISIWNAKNGDRICASTEHAEPVKAVSWIQHTSDNAFYFLSASQDQTVILWQFDATTTKVKPIFRCKGHTRSVECLAVDENRTKFASGSWDCSIKLWSTSTVPEEGSSEEQKIKDLSGRKRQKIEKKGFPRSPKMTVTGHTEAVSGLSWLSEHELCSSSWDHTLRLWDMEQGTEVSLQRGTKAITSLDYSPYNRTIVTGNTDRHIRLWDPRSSEGAVVKGNLTSHNNWVTCINWSPTEANKLVSGSLDNMIKMWDTRSPKTPLFDMSAHEDKVMCIDWTSPQTIASGGADNKAFTFSTTSGSVERRLS